MSKGKVPYGIIISGVNYGAKLAPPAKKLEPQGGKIGDSWDDGVNDNVRMITVTYDGSGVNSVKFEYAYGTNTVVGDHRELKNDEYITSIKGHYGKRFPPSGAVRSTMETLGDEYMTMLEFKTNITTYQVSGTIKPGYEFVDKPFKLEEEGHKIVGFYGKSTSRIQQIGVYVKPIDDAQANR
ncbi:unnamed protein product [Arabis nemorensis]|uniref:Jacalin-type lectin domain-containing protein n=1 Tax=Arabis nemorensis TaxID=586526 RepID=A0A565CED7_9BRAS|nr:unnamed protein product [Arabis nemorensis]